MDCVRAVGGVKARREEPSGQFSDRMMDSSSTLLCC